MYFLYILYSIHLDRYYVGSTEEISIRLKEHFWSHKGFTSKAKDWELKVAETITFSNGSTSTSSSTKVGSVFQDVKFIFKSDSTFTASGYYNSVETIQNPDGSTEVKPIVIVALNKTGSYTLKPTQGILTLTDQDAITTVYEIKKYTPTEMRLYSEDVVTNGNSTVVTTQDVQFSR
ncbi:MAG: GIY-YIG nuclease family protein [Aequorivita sp.]